MKPIDISGLTKRFGDLTAVDRLDLSVAAGEIYGLLGPNGAGKSTTIRTLLGFIAPSSGRVNLLGGNPRELAVRARVGYLSGSAGFDADLRVGELLTFYADLRGGVDRGRIDELCQRLALDPSRHIAELSKGNLQKVGVVQAFMHDPDVLVLDEPSSGLDPLQQRTLLDLIRARRDAGAAVLFSSHVLPEVEDVADRVGILRRGRLVREDSVAALREVARQRVELRFGDAVPDGLLTGIPGVTTVEVTGSTARVIVDGSVAPLLDRLAGHGVDRFTSRDDDLEDIFFDYYQEGAA